MELDGNGWVDCACGARHWGLHGAAGLFLVVDGHALLQLRPKWAHQGGTWAIPGGARDSHESVVSTALREAHEEAAIDPSQIEVVGVRRLQHPDWRYDTVLARAPVRPQVEERAESVLLDWVPVEDLPRWDLHQGFRESLPDLLLPRLSLLIDGANVVGSRPDGWWHDRAGAALPVLSGGADDGLRHVPAAESRDPILGDVLAGHGRAGQGGDVGDDMTEPGSDGLGRGGMVAAHDLIVGNGVEQQVAA